MNPVVLSTIHRAKGREWDVVFTDVTEGYMPFYRCAVSPSREEEERLLYVAMTRAKTTLHFGYFCEDEHPDIPCGLSQLCVPLWPDVESAPRRMTSEEEILDNCDYDFREW